MFIFQNKYQGGLLSLGDEEIVGEGVVEEMSPMEEIQAQQEEQEFNGDSQQVEEGIVALESMEHIVEEGEAQVIQNEVNQAALDGSNVPEDATVVAPVEVDGEQEVAAVAVPGEVPEAQLNENSTPEEIGVEAVKIEGLMNNFSARLRIGNADDLRSYLGVSSGYRGGLNSIVQSPLMAYKEGCEGFKETLVKYKNKVIAFLQKIGQTIVRWFRKFVNACKMTKKRAKSLKEKLKDMKSADYKIKENSKLPSAVAWVYGYDKTGKDYISKRISHVDDVIKRIRDVAKEVLNGKKSPEEVNKDALKKYGQADSTTTAIVKSLFNSFKFLIKGGKEISGASNGVKIFIPVDNEKAYCYGEFDGNADSMDGFPRLQTVAVKQEGQDTKSWFGEVSSRLDVAMNLCNSIINQADGIGKKMDDASKTIDTFKKDISNLVSGGNAEGEGMANRNYAVRRSITVASDMFKVSYIYGVVASQALTAAYGLVGSLEKKESSSK